MLTVSQFTSMDNVDPIMERLRGHWLQRSATRDFLPQEPDIRKRILEQYLHCGPIKPIQTYAGLLKIEGCRDFKDIRLAKVSEPDLAVPHVTKDGGSHNSNKHEYTRERHWMMFSKNFLAMQKDAAPTAENIVKIVVELNEMRPSLLSPISPRIFDENSDEVEHAEAQGDGAYQSRKRSGEYESAESKRSRTSLSIEDDHRVHDELSEKTSAEWEAKLQGAERRKKQGDEKGRSDDLKGRLEAYFEAAVEYVEYLTFESDAMKAHNFSQSTGKLFQYVYSQYKCLPADSQRGKMHVVREGSIMHSVAAELLKKFRRHRDGSFHKQPRSPELLNFLGNVKKAIAKLNGDARMTFLMAGL
ncbi:hypothetical protein GUITHDRAFT_161902 [Guillardia theta CCMP2712]|uniref:Uncharacterized protein n=1 Tax=Guillardia theta (strain CCMP2712) TaxID=905079 RepID=L1JP53_GUITC|nr:hypothetical protein GUITHDRAFT_161902 [Guillardia theta CCMP2712]EKX50237.1 hypothetical protein GUITHDRAFT_161902 [Guillardia theta CCMP2712]|eukprot:XP_005837217.1 hypothetical protein GUITHDRAFT_161902 [Guillardia theta CCMP2712]